MDSLREWREPTRLQVQWLVLYANKKLIGQGTLRNVSHEGGQVVGTMPVAVGMVLKIWISPADRDEALYVKEARVLWVRGHEFWLEFRQVDVQDHQWLINFLKNADRALDSKSDASYATTAAIERNCSGLKDWSHDHASKDRPVCNEHGEERS